MKLIILTLFLATISLKTYSISDSLITLRSNDVYYNQNKSNIWANKIKFLNEYTLMLNDNQIVFFHKRCNDIVIVDNIHAGLQLTKDGLIGSDLLNGLWIKE